MPFISRNNLPPEMRAAGERKIKAKLREALLSPGLTADQRTQIKLELDAVGKAKVYDANRPPRPGAISFEAGTPGGSP